MFQKIKRIFERIVNKQKLLEESYTKTTKSSNFKQKIKENIKIYNIQKQYEEGKIIEDDMQIAQIKELIDLYKKQLNIV